MDSLYVCGKCHNLFEYHELKIKTEKLYGQDFVEKACPYCGSLGYTAMIDEYRFDKHFYTQQN